MWIRWTMASVYSNVEIMQDPGVDARLTGGSVWRLASGCLVVVVSAPCGFVLVSWPASKGMLVHVTSSGDWEFPDRHALAEALKDAEFIGPADST